MYLTFISAAFDSGFHNKRTMAAEAIGFAPAPNEINIQRINRPSGKEPKLDDTSGD